MRIFYYAFAIFIISVLVFLYYDKLSVGECVAVIPIEGEIVSEGIPPTLFERGMPGSSDLASAIKKASQQPNVKAILLKINSPGGSVVATREIYNAVKEVDKPVVSYLGEVAASGAFYIAVSSDYIVADPNSITGSIGVIAVFTNLKGLFDKIGVNVTVVKSGKMKDLGLPFRQMSEEERAWLSSMINETYKEFLSVVKEGRGEKLSKDWKEYADGRVFSGRFALKKGFIDKLGSFDDAVEVASRLAGYNETLKTCEIDPFQYSNNLLGYNIFSFSLGLGDVPRYILKPGLYFYWG